jgi:hypothetical protein
MPVLDEYSTVALPEPKTTKPEKAPAQFRRIFSGL